MSPQPAQTPSEQIISRDLPCAECGYNLRALPARAHCPECNRPVVDTLDAPANTGTLPLLVALLAGVAPWLLARPLVVMLPIRQGVADVAILFAASSVASLSCFFRARSLRRRWGRHRFGRSGLAALLVSASFALIGSGFTLFWGYLSIDRTVYAPGFDAKVFSALHPGMTRAEVEQLIGPPLKLYTFGAEQVADYSKRVGFFGWMYRVCYDRDSRVKTTYAVSTAD